VLRHLQIRDFAIIESVELEFKPGLTVLTGETGAGKSIIVDALELLCGGRAGPTWCARARSAPMSRRRSISQKPPVSCGTFSSSNPSPATWTCSCVVWSVATAAAARGSTDRRYRSRCCASVTELLFDIHGQHEFQSLVRPATQRALVDTYGRLDSLASQVRAAHSTWLALMNRSVELEGAAERPQFAPGTAQPSAARDRSLADQARRECRTA
jgi:DNA repair protein RecN (Recombination protein N)